jgi:murein DD-endopeptidase MepM/ murein hydrolase activator NlpD
VDDRKTPEEPPLTRRELRERERRVNAVLPDASSPVPSELTTSTAVLAVIDNSAATRTTEIPLPAASSLPVTDRLATRLDSQQAEHLSERRSARRATTPQPASKSNVKPGHKPARTTALPAAASSRRAHRTSHSTSARAESARPAAPAWTPSRSIAAPATPSRSARGRARGFAAKGASVAVLAVVALMAVSTSLPAAALLSSADVQTAALALKSTKTLEGQKINVAGGADTLTVQRDGYEAKSIAEVAAASGIRLEATFTNNPNGTIQWPFAVGVHVGDEFGYRDCAGCSSNHGGQDFNPGIGAPIQSIADGVVSLAEDGEGSLGVHMMIDHVIDGKTVTSVYAHMIHGSMNFKTGDVVKVGEVIGKTGSTGMSTGPHLHFEIRLGGIDGTKVNPLVWLRENTN